MAIQVAIMVKRLQVAQAIVVAARLPQRLVLPTAITPPQAATRVTTPLVRMGARMVAMVAQAGVRRVSAPITALTCRAQWRVT